MSGTAIILALGAAFAAQPPAGADNGPAGAPVQRAISFTALLDNGGGASADSDAFFAGRDAPELFGAEGTNWLTFGGGIAYDLDDSTDLNLRAAFSHFIVDDVEISPELNLWYHDQDEDDELGVNPAVVFRWHVWKGEDWTVFADAGIGVLFTTDSVPTGGTHVNFTPRVGVGVTYDVPSLGGRLQAGVRWHHISNARIAGDRGNPATDAPMVYVGFMIPF